MNVLLRLVVGSVGLVIVLTVVALLIGFIDWVSAQTWAAAVTYLFVVAVTVVVGAYYIGSIIVGAWQEGGKDD